MPAQNNSIDIKWICEKINELDNIFAKTPNGSDASKDILVDDNLINHPEHYTSGSIESIDLMIEMEGKQAVADFCICNVWKYLYRHNRKHNNIADIRKLVWYANKYIELMKDCNENDILTEGKNDDVLAAKIIGESHKR